MRPGWDWNVNCLETTPGDPCVHFGTVAANKEEIHQESDVNSQHKYSIDWVDNMAGSM
jgi:hypothetical protein